MTDAKAFVNSAVAVYCSDPAGFGAQIDDLLSRFYEEDEKDQDRIVAEVSKRIRAGDEVAATVHKAPRHRAADQRRGQAQSGTAEGNGARRFADHAQGEAESGPCAAPRRRHRAAVAKQSHNLTL